MQSFNYEISLQGSIPKYSLFTCVDKTSSSTPLPAADAVNGILDKSIPPCFKAGQNSVGSYELTQKLAADAGVYPNSPLGFYGLGHRFCPEMS